MPRLTNLTRQHPVSVTFGHEGESLTVTFDRNKVTPAWIRSVQTELEAGQGSSAAGGLVEIMISWDVQDEQGAMVPPSVEILDSLPLDLLVKLHEAIGEAAAPSSEEGNGSTNTSATPPVASISEPLKVESLPNGQQPSPSPPPLASPSAT